MKTFERQDQSRKGVKVIVTKHYEDGVLIGTTVDADCQCYGTKFRPHSHERCPNLVRQ